MKKLLVVVFATLLSSHTYAVEVSTNGLAFTLAESIYSAAMGVATTEASSLATFSSNQKAEAIKIQNEAQNYYQSGIASIYLDSKIQLAKELNSSLSEQESVDLLVEASRIILAQ